MNRLMSFICVLVALVAGVIAVPPSVAVVAAKGPGIYGPTAAKAGQEVTITTVFIAKDRAGYCFSPDVDWGDRSGSNTITMGICMKSGASNKYRREVDKFSHTYTEAGTYTVTVQAAGISEKTGESKPSGANVRGPRTHTMKIVVTAPPSPISTASPDAASS